LFPVLGFPCEGRSTIECDYRFGAWLPEKIICCPAMLVFV
jgi:hypothetical protein